MAHAYNGDGLRASKTVLGVATPFTWSAAEGLPMLLSDGATNYVYGPGGTPIESVTATTPTYFHHDQLGSTRMLTDASGNATATFSYDPFGTVSARTGTATTPLGFAGEYADAETGFQYLRARFYDPATGQFVSRDPVGVLTRTPYAYALGNPMSNVDPSGLYGYRYSWNLGYLGDNGPQKVMSAFENDPNKFFPFGVDGPGGHEAHSLQQGKTYGLDFLGYHNPVTVEAVTSNSFTLRSLAGHLEGKGKHIEFSFCLDEVGNTRFTVKAWSNGKGLLE